MEDRVAVCDSCNLRSSEERLRVVWRMYLRCIWRCVVACRPVTASRSGKKGEDVNVRTHTHQVCTPSSRSVYRQVLERRKLGAVASSSDGSAAAQHDELWMKVSAELYRSGSLMVLQSSLTFSLAQLFLRRLKHLAMCVRPHLSSVATSHHFNKRVRPPFTAWRSLARERSRWRRWALRRCVEQWITYAQRRLALRQALRPYLKGVRERSGAWAIVRRNTLKQLWNHWKRSWCQQVTTRQLEAICLTVTEAKLVLHPTFRLRVEEPPNLLDGDEPLADTSIKTPFTNSHFWTHRCFQIWKKRTEQRLSLEYANLLGQRHVTRRCFRMWRVRWIQRFRSSGVCEARSSDRGGTTDSSWNDVRLTVPAPETAMVCWLKGFSRRMAIRQRRNLFERWRRRQVGQFAYRHYALGLLSRVIVIWIQRTARSCEQRQQRVALFTLWKARYLQSQRVAYADALYHCRLAQRCIENWRRQTQIPTSIQFRNLKQKVVAFGIWRSRSLQRSATRWNSVRVLTNCMIRWRNQWTMTERRRTMELVSEAIYQRCTLIHCFHRWFSHWQDSTVERRREEATLTCVDHIAREKRLRRLLRLWRERAALQSQRRLAYGGAEQRELSSIGIQ